MTVYKCIYFDNYQLDDIGECNGCCFDSVDDRGCVIDMQHDYVPPCWAEGREDKQDVIFKRESSSGDDSAVASDCLESVSATQRISEDATLTAYALSCHVKGSRSDDLCSR